MVFVCTYAFSSPQTESDLGSPGGKARIIHKESDIITAFAINKVKSFYIAATEQYNIWSENNSISVAYINDCLTIWPCVVFSMLIYVRL